MCKYVLVYCAAFPLTTVFPPLAGCGGLKCSDLERSVDPLGARKAPPCLLALGGEIGSAEAAL